MSFKVILLLSAKWPLAAKLASFKILYAWTTVRRFVECKEELDKYDSARDTFRWCWLPKSYSVRISALSSRYFVRFQWLPRSYGRCSRHSCEVRLKRDNTRGDVKSEGFSYHLLEIYGVPLHPLTAPLENAKISKINVPYYLVEMSLMWNSRILDWPLLSPDRCWKMKCCTRDKYSISANKSYYLNSCTIFST